VLCQCDYDLYDVPEPDAAAPFDTSRDFVVDKNNIAPRLGVVWTVGSDRRTVVRANTGIMYDQALLASYEQSLINNGTNARAAATFQPATAGAPAFPAVLSAGAGATPNTLTTVSRDFQVANNWQNNLQIERQLSDRFAASIGTSYVRGYNLPLITNINAINPICRLSDGRPIYSKAVNANTRHDPRYNVINQIESLGESTYRNFTAQPPAVTYGLQFDFAYTLGKAEDNAPITGVLSVQGDAGRTNPESLDFDKGPNVLDQRHTFTGSIVARPNIDGGNTFVRGLVNGTIVGVAMQFASGIPINLRANPGEINNDGINSDRPGIARNSLNLPARYNATCACRVQVLSAARHRELIAEVKNVFNMVQWRAWARRSRSTRHLPTGTVPTSGDQLIPTGGYEQRQLQFGLRFQF
jgi:hypothetical protein